MVYDRNEQPKTHFVASLKIEKVEKSTSPDPGARPGRVIDETAHITLKSETLGHLIEKLGKHIAIIEES